MENEFKILLVLPILIPLISAILSLLFWRSRTTQRTLSLIGSAILMAASMGLLGWIANTGIQSTQAGGWAAPYGITLVADLLSAIMVLMAGLMGLSIHIYSLISMDQRREAYGYYPLLNILLMGVCGAFLTGDLFNLYVWFEVMLIASFVLLALGGERLQLEGAIKYVTINLVSSAIFLTAVAILYNQTGTLNMADIAVQIRLTESPGLVTTLAMMFLICFGIKAAIFPLYFWLPASYHTPPVAITAIFAGLLTKVGVYSMIRVFTLIFTQDAAYTHHLLLILGGFTMVVGVLGAVSQNEFRRILSVHIVSQIGYMVMGLGIFTPLALAGTIYFLVHNIIVKTNLFLISGLVHRLQGSYELSKLGGLYRHSALISATFLISAMSLAGIPPLSGFWGKYVLAKAGFEQGHYLVIAASLFVSILTLYSMTKIWAAVFWKNKPERHVFKNIEIAEKLSQRTWTLYMIPILTLVALTVLMGLAAEPVLRLFGTAAEQLMNPDAYIQAVLTGKG